MGEIADMMLDGTLCQCCGGLLIDEGEQEAGYPVTCEYCLEDEKPKNRKKKKATQS